MPREDAVARDVLKAGASRGEPDGQADSFLRQKEVSATVLLGGCPVDFPHSVLHLFWTTNREQRINNQYRETIIFNCSRVELVSKGNFRMRKKPGRKDGWSFNVTSHTYKYFQTDSIVTSENVDN